MAAPLKTLRQQFRSWQNTRRLRQENDCYRRAFADKGLLIPDSDAIRDRMARQFSHLQAKPKGSLRILAIFHDYNWEETALTPALSAFGHVNRYDWMTAHCKGNSHWHRSQREVMNRHLLEHVDALCRNGGLDVIFAYLSGEQVTIETMDRLAAFGIPMVNLALNDKEHFVGKIWKGQAMGARDICRCFSLCWTSTEDALPKYCVEGALPVYLPEGANPLIHRPYDEEKIYDVSFVGQCYGNRQEIVDRLRRSGLAVEAFGFGWPSGPLSTEDMVRLYSRSRINLGFGGVMGHADTYCLKGRDFEIPMSGGLYVTEHHRELERVYRIDEEIVTYRDFEDLVAKLHHLLASPEEADRIRRCGFDRARRDHSWETRFAMVFDLMGLLKSQP